VGLYVIGVELLYDDEWTAVQDVDCEQTASTVCRQLNEDCVCAAMIHAETRKAYDTSESFLTFESHFRKKTLRCGTCTASFYLRKSTFRNRTSSIPESFLSQSVSCDWPVNITTQ